MNLKQIREEAWGIAREISTSDSTRLWKTSEMNRYINRVYRYIARETRCIKDAATPAICRITVKPPTLVELQALALTDGFAAQDLADYNDSQSWLYNTLVAPYAFSLDPRILDIDEVKWTKKAWRLLKVSVTKWQTNPWWERVPGMPTEYCTDYSNNTLAINYRATEQDTLRLVVKRMPLKDLSADSDVPEFREQYHDFMINGVLAQMYSKQDAETFNQEKKDKYEALYAKDVDDIKQQEKVLNQKLNPTATHDAFR